MLSDAVGKPAPVIRLGHNPEFTKSMKQMWDHADWHCSSIVSASGSYVTWAMQTTCLVHCGLIACSAWTYQDSF